MDSRIVPTALGWAKVPELRARSDAELIEIQAVMSGRWKPLADPYFDDCVIPVPWRGGDGPQSALDIASEAFLQYVETGDGCYIDNMHPDEMRAFIRDLGDRDRQHNHDRPGRGGDGSERE